MGADRYRKMPQGRLEIGLLVLLAGALVATNFWVLTASNWPYRLTFLLLVLVCLVEPATRCVLSSWSAIWAGATILVLFVMAVAGHGDRIVTSVVLMGRNIVFFLGGFATGLAVLPRRPYLFGRAVVLPVLVVDSLLALRYLRVVVGREFASRYAVADLAAEGVQGNVVNSLIMHYPNQVLILLMGVALLGDPCRWVRYAGLTGILVLSAQVLWSYWSAPLMMLLTAAVIAALFFWRSRRFSPRAKTVILLVVAGFVLLAITVFAAQSLQAGAAGQRTYGRVSGMLHALGDPSFDALDRFSGGRLSRASLSVAGFLNRPLLGQGDYWHSGSVGGHGLWFDALGKYGMIGAFPLLVLAVTAWRQSWRNALSPGADWTDTAIMLVTVTWILACFLNPYLHSRVGYVAFLCIGIASGRSVARSRFVPMLLIIGSGQRYPIPSAQVRPEHPR